jgi:hypothetical protein
VKLVKLADIYDNVSDATTAKADQLAKTLSKSRTYLESMKDETNESFSRCFSIVEKLVSSKSALNTE